MGSGRKESASPASRGRSAEAGAPRAQSWAPGQAEGPFLKGTEGHVSMSAVLVTHETCLHPVTGTMRRGVGQVEEAVFMNTHATGN